MKLVIQKLIPYQMKLGQPRENHPFDLITHHLSVIARQLIHQTVQKDNLVRSYLLGKLFGTLSKLVLISIT
jgi:hypothetical protein